VPDRAPNVSPRIVSPAGLACRNPGDRRRARAGGTTGSAVIRVMVVYHPDVPVLVLTAAPHGQHAAAALTAGADRILGKPVDLTDLAKAIRAAYARPEN